jgi:hypothetical protein
MDHQRNDTVNRSRSGRPEHLDAYCARHAGAALRRPTSEAALELLSIATLVASEIAKEEGQHAYDHLLDEMSDRLLRLQRKRRDLFVADAELGERAA